MRSRSHAALATLRLIPLLLGMCLLQVGCAAMSTVDDRDNPENAQSELMSYTSTFITTIAQAWNQAAGQQTAVIPPAPGTPATPATSTTPAAPATPTTPAPADPAASTADTPIAALQRTPAERARRAALEIKNANVSNAVAIATGPNPKVGVADMITLVTLQRMLLETPQTQNLFGADKAAVLVATYKAQEDAAWRMGARTFTQAQLDELREVISAWRRENPNARYVAGVRLEDYARERRVAVDKKDKDGPGSLLALVGLDPLANLDPTVQEVQRSRLLAERMFFYAQFAPQILRGQVESLYSQFLSTPELRRALTAFEQTSDAMDAIGAVADNLPDHISQEREAVMDDLLAHLKVERKEAIEQIGQLVSKERQALLADLDSRQDSLRTTIGELRETIKATQQLSESVKGTIAQADVLVDKVVPEPGAAGAPPTAPKDPNEPDSMEKFTVAIQQTSQTAEKLTALAERIDKLLASPHLDAKADGVRGMVESVQTTVKDTGRWAFWGVLALVVLNAVFIGLAIIIALRIHAGLERRAARRQLKSV